METIVAVAACALLAVQAHRNYLMVKNSRSAPDPIFVSVTVPEIEVPSPLVTTVVNESDSLDYIKLGAAIKTALIESGIALHNAIYTQQPDPSWGAGSWLRPPDPNEEF